MVKNDMKNKFRHLDLFTGIGGFRYAAETVWGDGYENVACCEIEKFCQQIILKHWPDTEIISDVRSDRIKQFRNIDLLTGGFPCQPFSIAGQKRGRDDDRHLWPAMLEVIRISQPKWVIAENVRGLLTIENGLVFEQVCLDLENIGYEVQPFIIPACAVNAPHRRDRVWIIANITSDRLQERRMAQHGDKSGFTVRYNVNDCNTIGSGLQWNENWIEAATRLCNVDDGSSGRLVRPKGWRVNALKAGGNAIVPQVAMIFMEAIKKLENSL